MGVWIEGESNFAIEHRRLPDEEHRWTDYMAFTFSESSVRCGLVPRALVLGTRSHRGLHEYMFANSMIPLLRQLKRTRGKLQAGLPEPSRPRHCYYHYHHPSRRYRAELACALKCPRRGWVV